MVLKLSAGSFALLNVEFLVTDAELAAEDQLIGLSILPHLDVDTKTLLENRRDLLDGTDCSSVKNGAPTRSDVWEDSWLRLSTVLATMQSWHQ